MKDAGEKNEENAFAEDVADADVADAEDADDAEDAKDAEDVEDAEDAKDAEDVEDAEDAEDEEDVEDAEDAEDAKDAEDVEVAGDAKDVKDAEDVDAEDAGDAHAKEREAAAANKSPIFACIFFVKLLSSSLSLQAPCTSLTARPAKRNDRARILACLRPKNVEWRQPPAGTGTASTAITFTALSHIGCAT